MYNPVIWVQYPSPHRLLCFQLPPASSPSLSDSLLNIEGKGQTKKKKESKNGCTFKRFCTANGRAAENYRLILWALESVGCAAKYILINHRIKRSMGTITGRALHQAQCTWESRWIHSACPKMQCVPVCLSGQGSHMWQTESITLQYKSILALSSRI